MAATALIDGELLGLPGCGKSTWLADYARRHGPAAVEVVPEGAWLTKLANCLRGLVRLRGQITHLIGLCIRQRRWPLRAMAVLCERAGRRAALTARSVPVLTDEGLLQAVWAIHWRLGAGAQLVGVVSDQVETVIYIRCAKSTLTSRLRTRGKGGEFDCAVAAGDTAAIARARDGMATVLRSLRSAGKPVWLVRSAS